MGLSVSILVPAFNEERLIGRVLEEVLAASAALDAEVIVVDDGSADRTPLIVGDLGRGHPRLLLVRHEANRGKAAALRSALAHATGDVVLVQDADLEYSPGDYGRLLAPFADPAVQAVYGSRFLGVRWPAGMAAGNWLANKVFVLVTNGLFGSALTDEGTAYKAFRRPVLEALGIESSRFEFCPEVTAKLLARGVRIVEVPVSYRARARRDGKKPGVRDGLSVLWTLLRYRVTG